MANKLSSKDLEKIGGRVIEPKKPVEKKPVDKGPTKEQAMMQAIVDRVSAAELDARKAIEVATANINVMQELVDRLPPPQLGIPPITGFKFIRDRENVTTHIEFIRDKKTHH